MSISSSPSLLITTMSIVLSQQACFPLPPPASLHKLIRWAWGCRESKVIELSVATVYPKFRKCWATLRVLTHVSNSSRKQIYPSSSISKWSLALRSIHPPDSLLAPTTSTIPNQSLDHPECTVVLFGKWLSLCPCAGQVPRESPQELPSPAGVMLLPVLYCSNVHFQSSFIVTVIPYTFFSPFIFFIFYLLYYSSHSLGFYNCILCNVHIAWIL